MLTNITGYFIEIMEQRLPNISNDITTNNLEYRSLSKSILNLEAAISEHFQNA